jgi:hypothetical protein
MFNANTFRTSNKSFSDDLIFQGAVNASKKLPMVRKHSLLQSGVKLVGYAGKQGCFSYRQLSDNRVDVSIYPEAYPESLTESDIRNAPHSELEVVPGWGFKAIQLLKAEL